MSRGPVTQDAVMQIKLSAARREEIRAEALKQGLSSAGLIKSVTYAYLDRLKKAA